MRTIRIAAAIIREEAGRFLLVRKRGTQAFMQPGGKIDGAEELVACLIRELKEELGVDVGGDQLLFAGHMSAPAAHEEGATVEAALFHVALSSSQHPVAANEIAELLWCGPNNPTVELAELTQDIIRHFAENRAGSDATAL